MNKIKRKATVVKNYIFDWLGIDLYSFSGPYPILVILYILNIADLFYNEIGKAITNEPAVTYFISIPFILFSLIPMMVRLKMKWSEIKEYYKRKTASKSLGLASFVGVEFAAVVLGLIFGELGFFQHYIRDLGIRLQLILYGLTVPNLLSIIARGYIGQSLIARKLALTERIQRHLHAILVLVGAGFLIAGLALFILPSINEKQGPLLAEDFAYAQPSFINSTRHELTLISTLPNNRIIITEQFVYAKPGKYLFAYVFPYQIRSNLTDPNELNNNRIIDLGHENFPETQSSIVWIVWNGTSVGNAGFGRGGIQSGFEISGAIYENNRGQYSVILPLATSPKRIDPTHKVFGMMQLYQSNWKWDNLTLQLVIDGSATNIVYTPQVEKEGLYHKFQVLQNNRELLWTIPNEQTVSVRYDILNEIHDYERKIFFSGIFLGVGMPTLIGSIVDFAKWRRTDFIRYSGIERIKHYLINSWFTLLEMGISFQGKLQVPLEEQKSVAHKLYVENKNYRKVA